MFTCIHKFFEWTEIDYKAENMNNPWSLFLKRENDNSNKPKNIEKLIEDHEHYKDL
jgi:hypothetical protein